MNETNYRNQLQVELSKAGIKVFRNVVSLLYARDGTPVKVGLTGQADLLGIAPGGRYISVETKSRTGRIRPEQQAWADMINKMGGIAIFARPGEDVIGILTERLNR